MKNHIKIENFLELISTHLPDMLWAKDTTGKYLFVNKVICESLLMAHDTYEPIGKTDLYFALRERAKFPEDPLWHTFGELCNNSDKIILQELRPIRFEESGNIQGKLVYFEVHKAPFYDEHGKLIGVIGSGRDITTQKHLEKELETTKRLIQNGPVVVFEWSVSEGWPIKFVSPNITSVLGINETSLLSKNIKFSDFIHPDDIETVTQEVNSYLQDQTKIFIQEYRIINESNKTIWIKDFTVVDYDIGGKAHSIKGYIFDDTAKKLADQKAEYLNHYDQLTGLQNRTKLALDMKKNHPKGCAIFNIDSFREVNDFFGIAIGDEILVQLANTSREMNIPTYRIGGDEFAILLYEDFTLETLREYLNSLLLHLHTMIFTVKNEVINIQFNVGASLGNDKLLTQADIALHRAKEQKISIAIYEVSENIEENYKKNIEMASIVHSALADGRIICHYQPIHHFTTGEISKYEALVRIIDTDGKLLSPSDFLAIAKKTKLYPRLTLQVISHACRCFASRTEEFSVNISIDDINNPHTVQEIINTIIETQTANRIVFEILESEGIENYTSVTNFITQVKELGAKIAIDDFGTGYSNFEHILKLNVDYIKIDGSLIRGIATDARHHIIVEMIAEFAKKIGAKTIAEFVCDEEVYKKVKLLGIDFAQGYFTGKPALL